jgi:aspartate-semialdehyde dehydrogenase
MSGVPQVSAGQEGVMTAGGGPRVAIVGATGVVGGTVRRILEERAFPLAELRLLASERSAGRKLAFRGAELEVQVLGPDAFAGIDLAFFAAGGDVSREWAARAVAAGATVIDKSSVFRMDPTVPLVVPEVNAEHIGAHTGIIATPNCSTIQMVVALKPIYDAAGIERVVVSTYQAVSGSGQGGIAALDAQAHAWAAGAPVQQQFYPHQIAFNVLPHIDSFLPSGYTKEEQKMVDETKKIFDAPELAVTATCVRVPVFGAHSEAVNVQTRHKLSAAAARELLAAAPGVEVVDDPAALAYPMPLTAEGTDPVFVGRLREDTTIANGLDFWVVSDNLRKGAALNAVQIAEELVRRGQLGRVERQVY